MNYVILVLLNSFLISFESVMAAYLGGCFFGRKCSRAVYILSVCLLAGFSILIILLFGDILVVKMMLAITLHTVWIRMVFQPNWAKALFTAFLLLSYWTIVDNLFLMGISWIAGSHGDFVFQSPYAYYLMCFAAKAFELIGIAILRLYTKKRFQTYLTGWTDWLRTLFFPVATLLASIELLHMFYLAPELARELAMTSCVLLIADAMSIFLLDHMEKQQIAIRDNVILQQDLKNERESISAWVAAYREERKRSHDFQNQLSVLRGMVAEHVSDETFLQYIDSLLNVKLPATRYINTNRPVADVLLSQKAAIAKNKGISFQMQLDDLSMFPLTDDELVVVLANLLDNAIEACERLPADKSKQILIKIQCKPEVTYLYIENATAEPVAVKNNRVVISRKNSNAHGFGLQNVATILDMHHVIYSLSYQEDARKFCFSAQLLKKPE